ncbi:MAG TPA: histidine kinase [Bacteroidales bacterium]|nr:histidine kinase [Bacteroidales bacterium]
MKVNLFEYQPQRLAFSIVITILLSAIFIRPGYKYKISVYQKTPHNNTSEHYYFDLNNDGKSEKLLRYSPSPNKTSVIVYNSNTRILGQFNLYGQFPGRSDIYTLDYDHSGHSIIIVFTHLGDSLFINVVDPYAGTGNTTRSRFIDIAPLEDGYANYVIQGGITDDGNNDGYSEIYFSVNAGFALVPRNLYYYDFHDNAVKKSPLSGTGPRYIIRAADIDNDGHVEIWGDNSGYGNYKTPVPYTDQKAWFMLFSHTLDFKFEPVGFPEFPAKITPVFFHSDSENYFAVVYQYTGTKDTLTNRLMLFTTGGSLLKSISLEKFNLTKIDNCFTANNSIIFHDTKGILISFDRNLKKIKQIQKEDLSGVATGPYNLTGDKTGTLLISRDNSIWFYNEKGEKISGTVLENTGNSIAVPAKVNSYDGFTGVQLKTDNFSYLLTLSKRGVWLIFLASISGLFIIIYLTVFFIQYIQIVQLEKKTKYESKLREYQLIAVKNQISPHFIFNALTSISAMYHNEDPESANDFMVSLSRLMENVVETSDKTIVDIESESELVGRYLAIEKIRFGDDFHYSIQIPDDCKNVKIPSMSIHTFVENAVKHGLSPKKGSKQLDVYASRNRNSIKVVIEDNGPGLGSKYENIVSTGRGLIMVSQMFSTYRLLTGKEISYRFEEKDTGGLMAIITISGE